MRIDFDRISKLAGLPASGGSTSRSSSRRNLNESYDSFMDEMADIAELDENMYEEEDMEMEKEGMHAGKDDDMEEMIEVDEVMLVQELRRAKRVMQENRRRQAAKKQQAKRRKQKIFESQLKQVIDQEVQSVIDEMNLNSGWVYGNNRPRRSRNGYTHQGSYMPGYGFRR